MFPVGSPIQIIGYIDKRKLNSRILGWADAEFVIIEHPMVQGELAMLPKDAAVVCRGKVDGHSYAFKSRVLHVMTQPFNYLFLVYPHNIQELGTEEGPTVSVDVPTTLALSPKDVDEPPNGIPVASGTLLNVGHGMCSVDLGQPLDVSGVACVFLTFDLPNDTSVENLKGQFDPDFNASKPVTRLHLRFDENDPKGSALFDFLLLASKILSQSAED